MNAEEQLIHQGLDALHESSLLLTAEPPTPAPCRSAALAAFQWAVAAQHVGGMVRATFVGHALGHLVRARSLR
jgi:hypothetical protein